MAEIRINDFSAGWVPGDDPVNGRKNGLLQMNNMELDSNGALTLSGGTLVKQSGYPSDAHTLFSRLINGARHDYAALANGAIYRDGGFIGGGGDGSNAAFGTAFDFTLICSGHVRVKDTGAALLSLGVSAETVNPVIALPSSANIPAALIGDLAANTVTPVGTSAVVGSYLQMTANGAGSVAVQTFNGAGAPHDCMAMIGPATSNGVPNIGIALDSDTITLTGYTPNPVGKKLQFDVLLVAGGGGGAVVSDYYTYALKLDDASFDPTTGVFTFFLKRGNFDRVGNGVQNWSTVYGFRITYTGVSGDVINILHSTGTLSSLTIAGGSKAQTGTYQYMQVNVNNTGNYLAKSVMGILGPNVLLENSQANILPQTSADAQVNEIWVFRRGGNLDTWYRVGVFANPPISNVDYIGDQEALELNIKYNPNLISIAAASVPDKIYDIVGPLNGRWYYFTTNFIYPSDLNDPDLVDPNLAVRICGSSSELFMWARKLNDSTVLVGTSIDIYTLSGTFATFPDNSIDIYYRSLQCKYPPLTCDVEVWGGLAFYMANDGWRSIDGSGSNPSLVSPTLDRLYRGESLQGYEAPNLKVLPRSVRFPFVIAKNKMWCFITGITTQRIEVYDFIRQYWRPIVYGLGNVTAATHTQDGQVLAFYGTDKKLREIGIQGSKLLDGVDGQIPLIKTLVFDGGLPRQRKDSSTFKIRSANPNPFDTILFVDTDSAPHGLGSTPANGLLTDYSFDLSSYASVALVKTYQVLLGTSAVLDLLIDDISIVFDPRPEQRHFIRVQGNNYGTTARKRIASVPFQVDTLGNSMTVTPILDGIPYGAQAFVSNRKQSFNYDFSVSGVTLPLAADFEYLVHSSGLMEFFGFSDPRIVETFQQGAVGFNVPVSNFGNANKKRMRVWPFVLSAKQAGTFVTFTPLVDGVSTASSTFSLTTDKRTYFHFFKTDVFGVDYGGYFSSSLEYEVDSVLPPEIVQTLPIAKRFDQVGPEEFFRYGKIKQVELRVHPFGGSSIPFTIYFNDNTSYTNAFAVTPDKEATYFLTVPKGTSGNVVRIELGPTDFDFHRFYTRLQVAESGSDTELRWINL